MGSLVASFAVAHRLWLWLVGSVVGAYGLSCSAAHGTLVSGPRMNSGIPCSGSRVLTTGPPENSLFSHFLNEIKKKKNTTFYFILEYTWLVSGGQKSDSLIDIQISILPEIPLPSRLPQNIEQSSLCYTVGPCWFSILNKALCACWWQTPYLTLPCLFSHFCYCPLKYWHFLFW